MSPSKAELASPDASTPEGVAAVMSAVNLAMREGRIKDAGKALEQALSQAPSNSMFQKVLLELYRRTGNAAAGLDLCRRILTTEPENTVALSGVANSADSAEERDRAVGTLLRVARQGGVSNRTWAAIALHHWSAAKWPEAVAILDEGIALTDSPVLRLYRSKSFPKVASSRTEIETARAQAMRELEILRDGSGRIENLLSNVDQTSFHIAYHHHNAKDLQRRYAEVHLKLNPNLDWRAPGVERPITRKRPRIGYLSNLHGMHLVKTSITAMIEQGPADAAEHLMITTPGSAKAEGGVPVLEIPANLEQARAAVANMDLDILIYPEIGMDPFCYYLAFSRLAPVQMVMPGHGVTTGVPAIDYYLTSAHWEASDNVGDHYTEQPVLLSTPPYFFQPDVIPPTPGMRDALGLDAAAHIYLCIHSIYKYHPDFDEVMRGILERDPAAQIVVLSSPGAAWWDLLWRRWQAALGDLIQRVKMVPRQTRPDFLGLLQMADVILDSFHHGSGVTAYEALYIGTPIITMRSQFMRGGMTAGLYELLGLADFVAPDTASYVDLAVQVASDRARRKQISDRLLAARSKLVCSRESSAVFVETVIDLAHRRRFS